MENLIKFFAFAKITLGALLASIVLSATAQADAPSHVRLRSISYAGPIGTDPG